MTAAILAVGDELFAPGCVESNSVFLTEQLARYGIPVGFRAVVGDDEQVIAFSTESALKRNDLVFLTGGLGPTSDDLTRDAVSSALGLELSLDETILDGIRARFERRGITMPEVNRCQAMVPKEATVLPNRRGTAPGLWIPVGSGKAVVLLPGPPPELEPMFRDHVAPRLNPFSSGAVYEVKKLRVAGLAESSVEQKIASTYRSVANPSTTILASEGQVEIRLTATDQTSEAAAAKNEILASSLREILGDAIFTENEEELEDVVGSLLVSSGKRITVAESLTGGLIAERITDVPGSSRYFDESFVTYSNEAKSALLGVPAELFERVGAVSEEVARAMATGAWERSGADIAVAVTGVAGPTGGSERKPVGLVYIALAAENGVHVERFQFPGARRQVKRWTSQAALNMVRLALLR